MADEDYGTDDDTYEQVADALKQRPLDWAKTED